MNDEEIIALFFERNVRDKGVAVGRMLSQGGGVTRLPFE